MAVCVVVQVDRGLAVSPYVSGPDDLRYALVQLVIKAAIVLEPFQVGQVARRKVAELPLRSPPTAGHTVRLLPPDARAQRIQMGILLQLTCNFEHRLPLWEAAECEAALAFCRRVLPLRQFASSFSVSETQAHSVIHQT